MKKVLMTALLIGSFTASAYSGYVTVEKMHPDNSTTLLHPGATDESGCVALCTIDSACLAVVYDYKYRGCYLKSGSINGWRYWADGTTFVKQ